MLFIKKFTFPHRFEMLPLAHTKFSYAIESTSELKFFFMVLFIIATKWHYFDIWGFVVCAIFSWISLLTISVFLAICFLFSHMNFIINLFNSGSEWKISRKYLFFSDYRSMGSSRAFWRLMFLKQVFHGRVIGIKVIWEVGTWLRH